MKFPRVLTHNERPSLFLFVLWSVEFLYANSIMSTGRGTRTKIMADLSERLLLLYKCAWTNLPRDESIQRSRLSSSIRDYRAIGRDMRDGDVTPSEFDLRLSEKLREEADKDY